jgi:hypothetical protein
VYQQGCRFGLAVTWDGGGTLQGGKPQHHEFSIAFDGFNASAWQVLFERRGIVDEVRLAKRDGKDFSSKNCLLQSTRDGFDFRKFRHGEILAKL